MSASHLDHTEGAEMSAPEALASHLIDVWCADKGRKIPWQIAVKITAIVTKMPDAERDRLLNLGDEFMSAHTPGICAACGEPYESRDDNEDGDMSAWCDPCAQSLLLDFMGALQRARPIVGAVAQQASMYAQKVLAEIDAAIAKARGE